ncbi:MAG: hypothetical protein RL684_843 [Pseudomonadota bacterium]|jgi:hypothetical protein
MPNSRAEGFDMAVTTLLKLARRKPKAAQRRPGIVLREVTRDDWGHVYHRANLVAWQRRWCHEFKVIHPRLSVWQAHVIERARREQRLNGDDLDFGFVVYATLQYSLTHIPVAYPVADIDSALAAYRHALPLVGTTAHGCGRITAISLRCARWISLEVAAGGAALCDEDLEAAIREAAQRGLFPSSFGPHSIACL